MNPRLLAARIIDQVTDGRSLTDCFANLLPSSIDPRDRGFVQAVCYGVCRYYARLDVVLSHLLKKPMQSKDSDVHALILVGLYQLMDMRVPVHAAVAETVNASEKLKKPWSRGFVNAILREYLRRKSEFDEIIQSDEEAAFAHPEWWIRATRTAWPDHWQDILIANNQHPPFSLRVNQRHLTREEYLAKLDANAVIIPETKSGIILETPIAAEELPGFAAGDISVQDGAAQLAAELLEVKPGQRVLDACAAPGGKLTNILEREPNLAACIAVDNDPARMSGIKENLQRLQLQAQSICADVANTKAWWDGKLFDRILLDAPCSASGVIRRHPDIKLLRQPEDMKVLAEQQYQLLIALAKMLQPGGVLLYATCSIFPEENVKVVQRFLEAHKEMRELPIQATWGHACTVGRQILPGQHGMDGFYYARLFLAND